MKNEELDAILKSLTDLSYTYDFENSKLTFKINVSKSINNCNSIVILLRILITIC